MEKWKDIEGYKGLYQVSDIGEVKSLFFNKEKILKKSLNKYGYLYVNLYLKGKYKSCKIHKLVAIAFLNHTPVGMKLVVNHIDLNRLNNKLSNLEVITNRENCNHKHLKSSSIYTGVSWSNHAKKWMSQIWKEGGKKHLGYFINEIEAHHAYEKALSEI